MVTLCDVLMCIVKFCFKATGCGQVTCCCFKGVKEEVHFFVK